MAASIASNNAVVTGQRRYPVIPESRVPCPPVLYDNGLVWFPGISEVVVFVICLLSIRMRDERHSWRRIFFKSLRNCRSCVEDVGVGFDMLVETHLKDYIDIVFAKDPAGLPSFYDESEQGR